MAINTYDRGDLIRIAAVFKDSSNTAYDPTAVLVRVIKPNNTETTYAYGLSSQGNWNASTNVPALADGTGTAGNYYSVSVAGSQSFNDESISFVVGDKIYYNGYTWQKIENLSSTAITKDSKGTYHIDVYITLQGNWYYQSEGLGNVANAEHQFYVEKRNYE